MKGDEQMIDQRAHWQHHTATRRPTVAARPGTMTAFVLIALVALVALALTLAPAFAASVAGMLLMGTATTAAGLYCHRLMR